MRKIFLSVMLIAAISFTTKAQGKKEKADFANWVIESNVKTPHNAIVRFYNEKQELIYQETITGTKIKIKKVKVKKALNQVLNQLLSKQYQPSDTALVVAAVKR